MKYRHRFACLMAVLLQIVTGCALAHVGPKTGITLSALGEDAYAEFCVREIDENEARVLGGMIRQAVGAVAAGRDADDVDAVKAAADEAMAAGALAMELLDSGSFCMKAKGAKISDALAGVLNAWLASKGIDAVGEILGGALDLGSEAIQ